LCHLILFLSCVLIKKLFSLDYFLNNVVYRLHFKPLWFIFTGLALHCLPFVLLRQKGRVIFIFGYKSFLSQNDQMGSLLIYFNWLHSGWQKCFHLRDTVFPYSSRRILQNIYSFMEMTDHDKYMHKNYKISLKKKSLCWRKYFEDFTAQKVGFSYSPSGLPDARVRTPCSESQNLLKVRIAQQKLNSESKSPKGVQAAQQTQATKSICLHKGPNTNAMTTNNGSTLYNRPNALQFLPEILVASLDATYVNPSLSRIRIYEASFKEAHRLCNFKNSLAEFSLC